MFRQCLPPFSEFKSSGPYFSKSEGRVRINLLNKEKRLNRNVTYARYLLSVSRGSEPEKGLDVDHIDGDRTHDILSNLQVLTRTQNTLKKFSDVAFTHKIRKFILSCAFCGKEFERTKRLTHLGNEKHFCSKACCAQGWGKNCLSSSSVYEVEQTSFKYKEVSEPWEAFSKELSMDSDSLVRFNIKPPIQNVCRICEKVFFPKRSSILHCSDSCKKASRQGVPIEKKTLAATRILEGASSWEEQGRLLGMSGSGLRKWAKNNGLLKSTPGRT